MQKEIIKIIRFTVAFSGLIGIPYAFIICTKYGRIAALPENSLTKNEIKSKINGLIVLLCSNSVNRCRIVSSACVHFRLDSLHLLQLFIKSL